MQNLEEFNFSYMNFGLYGLRSGGATAASFNDVEGRCDFNVSACDVEGRV